MRLAVHDADGTVVASIVVPAHADTIVQVSSSVTVSESNYAGTFTFADSPPGSCAAIVSWGALSAGMLPLTALGVGTCTVIASDTIGGTASLTVNVATTTLVGS